MKINCYEWESKIYYKERFIFLVYYCEKVFEKLWAFLEISFVKNIILKSSYHKKPRNHKFFLVKLYFILLSMIN